LLEQTKATACIYLAKHKTSLYICFKKSFRAE